MAVDRRHAADRVVCPHCSGIVPRDGNRPAAGTARLIDCRVVAVAALAALLLVGGMVAGSAAWLKRQRTAATRPPRTDTILRVATAQPVERVVPASLPIASSSVETPQAAPTPAVSAAPVVTRVVRLPHYDDEELRKQLLNVPELRLDSDSSHEASIAIRTNAGKPASLRVSHLTLSILDARPDLAGLPLRRGADCQLGKEPAEYLQAISRKIREVMNDRTVATMTPETTAATVGMNLRARIDAEFPEMLVPPMMQMLCVEQQSLRLMVVKQLAAIGHRRGGEALVKMALFDPSERIRSEAVAALKQRPAEEVRDALLAGFRYPWAPVAEHAAEALVALEDRGAVPGLKKLAEQADPAAPYYDADKQAHLVREVVRINHLRNCLMCHAPSTATSDLVRGRVPVPGEALPPAIEYYDGRNDGIFVRADITYLRQDFSLFQPVDNADPWPNLQRYDYVVRARPATAAELNARAQALPRPSPQRDAAHYALKALEEPASNGPAQEIAKQ